MTKKCSHIFNTKHICYKCGHVKEKKNLGILEVVKKCVLGVAIMSFVFWFFAIILFIIA
jgi:hypothetical protein